MYWTGALFPEPTLLVTGKGGTRILIFFFSFQTRETMIMTKSKYAFLVPPLVQNNPTLVTVLFEMRSHHQENALLMTVKISKVLFMNTLIYCVILCFYNCDMPLPYQLSRGHGLHRC